MKAYQSIAVLLLRIALSATFLSAVASRLSFWGIQSSGWENFLDYTQQVNSFAPAYSISLLAILSTIVETALATTLLIGYQTRVSALSASLLTMLFALAMAWSFGIKEPLDYSVFAFSAGSLVMATVDNNKWSLDYLLAKRTKINKSNTINSN